MAIDLRLTRLDRVYRPPDILDGTVVITTPSTLSHQGIRVTAVGTIMLQLSARSVGVFEALYNSVKPIQLLIKSVDISPAGKIPPGVLELPFHLSVDVPSGSAVLPDGTPMETLFETYHGAYVNIQYLLTVDVIRGYLQKSLSATTEFIVECRPGRFQKSLVVPNSVNFYITQDTQKHALYPSIYAGHIGRHRGYNDAKYFISSRDSSHRRRDDYASVPLKFEFLSPICGISQILSNSRA